MRSTARRFSWTEEPYIGAPLQVYGHEDQKTHLIHARCVVFAPEHKALQGQGIIDRILAPQPAGSLLVRADGYPVLLTPAMKITFAEPLHFLSEIRTDQWLEYHGSQRPDGVLVADKALLRPNLVAEREQHLQAKYADDPKSAAHASRPEDLDGYVARAFAGNNPKHIPPAVDPILQRRLDTIGQRLIPEYQRDLADSDPTRIAFRFQLIDEDRIRERIDLPNGIILVPKQAMMRLENDDQVAAYLAAGLATILEKQQLRFQLELRMLNVAQLAAWAPVSTFASFAVNPALLVGSSKREDLEIAEMQQRIRVSLALVNDAGYDLTEAPKAWWMLESKQPRNSPTYPSRTPPSTPTPSSARPGGKALGNDRQEATAAGLFCLPCNLQTSKAHKKKFKKSSATP